MDDYTYDSYDYQSVPDTYTSAVDTYDAYDYGGADQGGFAGTEDIMEGLGLTGIQLDTWNWGGSATPASQTTGDFSRADRMPSAVADVPGQGESTADKFAKFLSGVGDFAVKYKTPLEMIGRGLQAAAKSKSDEKSAQALSDSRIRELNAADQLKQNAAARYSDSVKGLRQGGLMTQNKLKRVGGSPVYSGGGLINRS